MSHKYDLIFVDDEPKAGKLFLRYCEDTDYRCHVFSSSLDALAHFEKNGADLLVTDLRMPEMGGLELLERVRDIDREVAVIIITAYSTVNSAIEALRLGAMDFLKKPFEMDELLSLVDRALQTAGLQREVRLLRRQLRDERDRNGIIGKSAAIEEVHNLVNKIADVRCNVIIQGETGTGKELVARAIHNASAEADAPFVVVDCGALSDTLLESELFGHKKGAFTGAVENKRGLIEAASGGTMFMDEIGNISDALQMKLLRVIQEQQVVPVGGVKPVQVNVRWLVASNEDLETMVDENRMRLDLYHRLNVVKVTMPALRERSGDMPLLVQHFVDQFEEKYQRGVRGFDAESMRMLLGHSWPGNIRELRNLVERNVVLADGPVMHLSAPLDERTRQSDGIDGDWPLLSELERRYLLKVLDHVEGNQKRASELLGIDKSTLWRKLRQYKRAEVAIKSTDNDADS